MGGAIAGPGLPIWDKVSCDFSIKVHLKTK